MLGGNIAIVNAGKKGTGGVKNVLAKNKKLLYTWWSKIYQRRIDKEIKGVEKW